ENSDFQRFRLRGVNLELEQKWEQLFGDSYATGENVYVPSIDPIEDLTIQNENLEEENIDNDGGDNYFPSDQYAQDLLNDEGNFFQHFIEQARNDANLGSSGSRSSQVTSEAVNNDTRPSNKIQKHLPLKSNSGQVKRTRRQSAGSAMISKGIIEMTECVKRISQSSTSNVSTISTAMNTICRMVENEYLEKHSEFWCFATTVIGDATKREIFLSMEDDDSRAKWLAYLYIKVAQGASNRVLGERFQRSGETISRAFHDVLNSISCRKSKGLAYDIIRPYDPTFTQVPAKITTDARYMPYFKDCIGCIDGTHIEACIPEALQMPYRGRKRNSYI
uniref:DUF8040 domain-containing protein n=1 Tax=Chenopodium quinoa TaxID=63459 RepID=A0A803M9X6_CHEQI